MPGIKGQHRKMFRKPGLARQAIGILASSPELAQEVQRGAPQAMQPQPVQNFNQGGIAELIGYNPGFDAQGNAIPGFGGFYQQMSGISDPQRAQAMRKMDLIRLGLRIAGGQSDDTATNVIQGLTGTLDDVSGRRDKEFALAVKGYELETARKTAEAERKRAERKISVDEFKASNPTDLVEILSSKGYTAVPEKNGYRKAGSKKIIPSGDIISQLSGDDLKDVQDKLGEDRKGFERFTDIFEDQEKDINTRRVALFGAASDLDDDMQAKFIKQNLARIEVQELVKLGGAGSKPVAVDQQRTDLGAGEFVMLKPRDARAVRQSGLPENTLALIKRGDSFGVVNPYTGRVQEVGNKGNSFREVLSSLEASGFAPF